MYRKHEQMNFFEAIECFCDFTFDFFKSANKYRTLFVGTVLILHREVNAIKNAGEVISGWCFLLCLQTCS